MQNAQNYKKDKSTYFRVTKIFLSKKKKSGQKVLSGLVKYMSVDQKEPSIDIYLPDFNLNLDMVFYGTEEVLKNVLPFFNKVKLLHMFIHDFAFILCFFSHLRLII